ncbi:MAG: hypothetical protein JRH09_15525 [Deltaproteobacteria bacterium]|nr:hypothetical protein [Deltaproteobacteria bacterium]
MIKLRSRPQVPKTLKSKRVTEIKEKLSEKVRDGIKPNKKDFKPYWLEDDVRKTLWKHHNEKCCYCERKRELKRESDVEHYRPKAGVTGEENHMGYWWLAYEWNNYLYACKPCNQGHKANHFPLMDGGIRAKGPADSLEDER